MSRCPGLHERRTHWSKRLGPRWKEKGFPLCRQGGSPRPSVRASLQADNKQPWPHSCWAVGAQLWMPGELLLWAGVQSQPHYRPEKPLVLWDADWRYNHFPVCCMNFYFLVSRDLTLGRKRHNLSLPSAICRSFSPQNKLASCLRQGPAKLPWLACSSLCGLDWLAWNAQRSKCLCLPAAGIRASHYHIRLVY